MKVLPEASNAVTLESDKYGDFVIKIHQLGNKFSITMFPKNQLSSDGNISNKTVPGGTIFISNNSGVMEIEMEHGVQHTVMKL